MLTFGDHFKTTKEFINISVRNPQSTLLGTDHVIRLTEWFFFLHVPVFLYEEAMANSNSFSFPAGGTMQSVLLFFGRLHEQLVQLVPAEPKESKAGNKLCFFLVIQRYNSTASLQQISMKKDYNSIQ